MLRKSVIGPGGVLQQAFEPESAAEARDMKRRGEKTATEILQAREAETLPAPRKRAAGAMSSLQKAAKPQNVKE